MRDLEHQEVEEIGQAEWEYHIQEGEESDESWSQVQAHYDEDQGHGYYKVHHVSHEEFREYWKSVGGVYSNHFYIFSIQIGIVDDWCVVGFRPGKIKTSKCLL